MMAAAVSPKASLTLQLPPSCMQFCPFDAAYLVVGTYNLHHGDASQAAAGEAQSRDGSLVVVRVEDEELTVLQTVPQPSAVLDLRFHPRQDEHRGVLAAVSSTGSLAVFRFDAAQEGLRHVATSRCRGLADHVLLLQCAWHPVLDDVIAVTDSSGAARLLHLDRDWNVTASTELDIGNSLEAWSIALSPPWETDDHGPSVSAYCGGDDSSLRYTLCSWEGGASSRLQTPCAPVTVRGQHDAGVTAILPLALHAADGGRLVVTGSYDDHLRVLAMDDLGGSMRGAAIKRPRLVCDANLGGGVWRLGLVDTRMLGDGAWRVRILASCMHAGPRLVELTGDADGLHWRCEVVARFDGHESMNYASDCVAAEGGLRCVSTSFYDRLLCVWDVCGGSGEAEAEAEAESRS